MPLPLADSTVVDQPAADHAFDIVLKPISHPELADIGIDEILFAVGRNEPPFDSYPPVLVKDLSRRHARMFCEGGVVHIADMGSKNGTSVNGIDVRQKTTRLANGDEVRFGHNLCFRVQLRARPPEPVARLLSLTLRPVGDGTMLQPIVVTQFPFLISKSDAAFARYRQDNPQQVNYLSRRHAHVFLKRGMPWVEDLGSTNGTFVGSQRLDEIAVPLRDGDTLGFGGHFFVYQVSLQMQALQPDPTLTHHAGAPAQAAVKAPSGDGSGGGPGRGINIEKTTFIGAPDSFLDIFCVDPVSPVDAAHGETDGSNSVADAPVRPPGRFDQFRSQLVSAVSGADRKYLRWIIWGGGSMLTLLAAIMLTLRLAEAPEREIRILITTGHISQAATKASHYLKRSPDHAGLRLLATEAWLKATVPPWVAALGRRDFTQATAVLATMRDAAQGNPDLPPLMRELNWITSLAVFTASGEGGDRPIRIYADEDSIAALTAQWDADPAAHQRAATVIAAQVPAFRDVYANALSQLRRLQSDNAVYLAAIERLKIAITTALQHEQPRSIDGLLRTAGEKYPRLAGLDRIRTDLQHYLALTRAVQGGRLGPLVAQQEQAQLVTPPFQQQLEALGAAGQLLPPELVRRYQDTRAAWRTGDSGRVLTALQSFPPGPWSSAASAELIHKKVLLSQYAALVSGNGKSAVQSGGGSDADHVSPARADRLLDFYTRLSPEDDVFLVRAVMSDPAFDAGRARKRADGEARQALSLLQKYRDSGGIDDGSRHESMISEGFRTQAGVLAQARQAARQSMNLYRLQGIDVSPSVRQVADDIETEAGQQDEALRNLVDALPSDVLRAKRMLIEDDVDAARNAVVAGENP